MTIPLLLGGIFTPVNVGAGFLSSILGDEVQADTRVVVALNNSQNMALLQVSATSELFLKDKKDSSDDLALNTNIVSDTALNPTTSSLGMSDGTDYLESSPEDISVYIVRQGDSLSQIADMFNVSVNTILWANDLKRSDKIGTGDVLFILPVSGVKHVVKKGESLNSIAKKYKVDTITITGFNGLSLDSKISIGDELIIPEAQMPSDDVPSKTSTPKQYYASSALKNLSGYFINPVPEYKRKSQDLHGPGNRGIDIAAYTGKPILASASGKVLLARTGYNGGYGSMVIIEHSNGTKTLYAHMSKVIAKTGAQVSQGEVIGLIGSTGRSTGPHLHFEVFNAKNPGTDWSWAK